MTLSWPPYGRWAEGYGERPETLNWVPKTTIAGKIGYAMTPGGHPELAAGFALVSRFGVQEQGSRLSVHPVAEQRSDQPRAGETAFCAARSVPHGSAFH